MEAWGGANPDLYVRKQKAGFRAQKSLQIGLVAGHIKATYLDGNASQPIPTWAWEHNERADYAWSEGRLPLDILLPDRWQRWNRQCCFIERESLSAWIKGHFQALGSDLPETMLSARRPPARVKQRPLPDVPYVPICESVSWIAYGIALPSNSLLDLIQTGDIGYGYQWAIERLEYAVSAFADAALGQRIRCIGKYMPAYSARTDDLTDFIPPVRFADFRRLDIVGNGLFFGSGLAQRMNEGALHLMMGEGRSDLLFDVRADRADLLAQFGGCARLPTPTAANMPKRVSRTALEGWLASLPQGGADRSQRELYKFAREHFGASVPRQWIRELTAGRKRGPKQRGQ